MLFYTDRNITEVINVKDLAFDFLSRRPLEYVDMLAPIRRGSAEIIAAGPEGVLLLEKEGNVHLLAAENDHEALRLLSLLREPALMCFHNQAAALEAERRFGRSITMECRQAVWTMPLPPVIPALPFRVRALDISFAGEVKRLYSHDIGIDYIEARLRRGEMWGAFDGDTLAGFIGRHAEGSMGMLEVFPKCRRRGIGRLLAAFLIDETLKCGLTPFSQFSVGNQASRRLNEALGMEVSGELLYWLE